MTDSAAGTTGSSACALALALVSALVPVGCGDSGSAEAGSTGETADEADGSSTSTDSATETGTSSTSETDTSTSESSDTATGDSTESSDTATGDSSESSDTATSDSSDGPDLCGNGMLDPGETCDDGNDLADDGCGPGCATECGYLCLEVGMPCISGFHAVQCASPGPPFGQPSPIANTCQLATLSVDGNHIALSPETTIAGEPRHLDAMYTDPSNAVFGFAGDAQDLAAGSRLVAVDVETGVLTPVGPDLGVWVMGAAMNDGGELWVTVFATYELNQTTQVRIAQVDPLSGEFVSGPTVLTENGEPVTVWSIHVSDVAFRFDGAMFVSANEPGPPPPEPLSRYLEVDRDTATVLSAVDGPNDLYAAGIVFVGEEQQVVAMDIRGADDIFIIDLSAPPTLDASLLYADPIETNSGTADLAGCSKLNPQ